MNLPLIRVVESPEEAKGSHQPAAFRLICPSSSSSSRSSSSSSSSSRGEGGGASTTLLADYFATMRRYNSLGQIMRPTGGTPQLQMRRTSSWARPPSAAAGAATLRPAEPRLEIELERVLLLRELASLQAEQNESLRMLLLLRLEQFMTRYQQMMGLLDVLSLSISSEANSAQEIQASLEVRRALNRISLDVLDTLSRLLAFTSPPQVDLPKGVPPEVIDSYPDAAVTEDLNLDGEECAICLVPYEKDTSGVKVMPCHHAFHGSCLHTWLSNSCVCPLCRAEAV